MVENKLPVKIVYLMVPVACKQVSPPVAVAAAAVCCVKQVVVLMKAEISRDDGYGVFLLLESRRAVWLVFDALMLCFLVAVVIVMIVNEGKSTVTDIQSASSEG